MATVPPSDSDVSEGRDESNVDSSSFTAQAYYARESCSLPTSSNCLTSDKQGADSALYEELLKKAAGDQTLVSLWLAEMGYNPSSFHEYRVQIKAYGTQQYTRASWATAGVQPKSKPLLTDDSDSHVMEIGSKDVDAEAADAGAPRHFFCPISMHIMRDPVMLPTGQSYERHCIKRWLSEGHCTCPATGQKLQPNVALVQNVSLRNAIEEWAEKCAPQLLDATTKRVKPLPKEVSFEAAADSASQPDIELAMRLQREELESAAQQRQQQACRRRRNSGRPTELSSQRRARSCFTLTTLLLLCLSAAYCTLYVLTIWQTGWAFADLRVNPLVGGSPAALMALGAQTASSLVNNHQWWRLLSSQFINAGLIQVIGNLASLWSFGKYLERVLPLPWLSLAGVLLVSGMSGALVSANLNVYYVTCGASAGVCGLLGGVWADQIFNFKRQKYWVFTWLTLAIATGVFVAVSLLPLLDPFYVVAAMLAGFLLSSTILFFLKIGYRRRCSGLWVVLQTVFTVLLIGGCTVAVIGVAINSKLGKECSFCQSVSCLKINWWDCTEVWSSGNGCAITILVNGTQAVECPLGGYLVLPELGITVVPGTDLFPICDQYCGSMPPSVDGTKRSGENATSDVLA